MYKIYQLTTSPALERQMLSESGNSSEMKLISKECLVAGRSPDHSSKGRVIALSVDEVAKTVGLDHYPLKDFETWVGYFAPGKLFVKTLNIVFPTVPTYQIVMEEKIKLYQERHLLDHSDAEYEVQKALVDGDAALWIEIVTEVWNRCGKDITVNMMVQDFIRKCLEHWSRDNLPLETTDKLTKLIHLSYQRKFVRYGTGYFNGNRGFVMNSLLPTALWSTKLQRTSMLAAEVMVALWPHIASWKALKSTMSTAASRAKRGTLVGQSVKTVWWVIKRGVFHLVVWGSSALGTAVVGAYWYPCQVKVLDNVGLLLGALIGETVASEMCRIFDGFIEPTFPSDAEEESRIVDEELKKILEH
jgi:hypothetical protein